MPERPPIRWLPILFRFIVFELFAFLVPEAIAWAFRSGEFYLAARISHVIAWVAVLTVPGVFLLLLVLRLAGDKKS